VLHILNIVPLMEHTFFSAGSPPMPYAAPAVEGALSILEALGAAHQLGVTELARRGYVEKDPANDRYHLTYRLFAVGSRAADRLGLREVAQAVMERLAAETGEAVNLGVLEGVRVVNLHRVESPNLLRVHLEVGGGMPAHSTGLGKVLLAALAPAEVGRRLAGRRLERVTPRTIGDRAALRRELARIREQGYAIDDEECSLGLRCVAASIRDHSGEVKAALSIAGPSQRLPVAALPA
jgi:DNA-binding IclR family transcriptional regulator